MHLKNIKAIIKKQLKTYYRNWKCLSKKEKKTIAKMVLDEVVENYDFSEEIKTPKHELLGIERQLLTPGIMDLDGMARFIDSHMLAEFFCYYRIMKNPVPIGIGALASGS